MRKNRKPELLDYTCYIDYRALMPPIIMHRFKADIRELGYKQIKGVGIVFLKGTPENVIAYYMKLIRVFLQQHCRNITQLISVELTLQEYLDFTKETDAELHTKIERSI